MSFISVFCTNSINIHAGINGLEVSQSVVIAISALIHNFIQLFFIKETTAEVLFETTKKKKKKNKKPKIPFGYKS